MVEKLPRRAQPDPGDRRRGQPQDDRQVLGQLIDKTGIPFVTTQMGKGVVDERHPRFLGNAALSAGDFVHRAVEAADLIVNVGHDVIEKPPFFMVRGGTEVIHVNFRSAEVDPVYFPQIEVVGDIANAIWQIGEALDDTAHWDFTRLLAIREANEAQVAEGADDPRFPLYPQRLVADVLGVAVAGHSRPGQRHVQDLVRPQLQGAHAQHRAAGQRPRHHGRRPALGDGRAPGLLRTGRSSRCAAMAAS